MIGRIALRKSKAKLFYTPHGYSFLMDNCSQLRRTIYKMIERLCAISNCTTICCSKGEYEESLLVTQNTTYVNNGINTSKINEILANVKKTIMSLEYLQLEEFVLKRIQNFLMM